MTARERSNMDSRRPGRKQVWLVFLCILVTTGFLLIFRGTARSMELNTSASSGAVEVNQHLQAPGESNLNFNNSITNFTSAKLSIDVSKTITSTLYLPLLQKPASPPRPLGVTQLITGPVSCDDGQCYQIKVTYPNFRQPIGATLMVGDPYTSLEGTILFITGWTGTYYWGMELAYPP